MTLVESNSVLGLIISLFGKKEELNTPISAIGLLHIFQVCFLANFLVLLKKDLTTIESLIKKKKNPLI